MPKSILKQRTPKAVLKSKIKKFFKLFKLLDLFGQKFVLKIDRRSNFVTIQGAILSLIALGLAIAFTFASLTHFFDTENPTINSSTKIDRVFPRRHFYDSKYPVAVSGYLNNGEHIPVADIYRYGTPLLLV